MKWAYLERLGFSMLSKILVACVQMVSITFSSVAARGCEEDRDDKSGVEAVLVEYLLLPIAGQFATESFDIGEVGIGENVPVLIRVMNRSLEPFEFKLSKEGSGTTQVRNGPVKIPAGDNGLLELVLKTPDTTRKIQDNLFVSAILGDDVRLQLVFTFRYRGTAFFAKPHFVANIPVPNEFRPDQHLIQQIPFEVSDPSVIDECKLDVDPSLEDLSLTIKKDGTNAFVEAKVPFAKIAKSKSTGKIRLKINDKIVSEATVTFKKETSIGLFPDWVSFQRDPATQEYKGEMILKVLAGTVPIEDVEVTAEHSDDLEVEVRLGKMSSSTGRIYLQLKKGSVPTNQDLILLRISTPLKTEEQVISVLVVP